MGGANTRCLESARLQVLFFKGDLTFEHWAAGSAEIRRAPPPG